MTQDRRPALRVTALCPEAVPAAVRGGADELMLPVSAFPSAQAAASAVEYARARGVKTLLDLTSPMRDEDMAGRAAFLLELYARGLDGVAAAEPGALRMAKSAAPGCARHWCAPAQNSSDIRFAAAQGCSDVLLSPFMSSGDIDRLIRLSPIPLGAAFIEPLCPAGDRAACMLGGDALSPCPLACRSMYGHFGKAEAPLLAARDLCLASHAEALRGLAFLTVTPPHPSPEAAALFASLARRAIDGDIPDADELARAFAAFGRHAPTDAPFTGTNDIFIRDGKLPAPDRHILAAAREMCSEPEPQRVPVRFYALIQRGERMRLGVDDYGGHTLYVSGPVPERASGAPLIEAEVNTQWYKTTGTFYRCAEARTRIEPGLSVPLPTLADMRRSALSALTAARVAPPERPAGGYQPGMKYLPRAEKPLITVMVSRLSQISPDLLRLSPARLYVPAAQAAADADAAENLARSCVPVAVLPRVAGEEDLPELAANLETLYAAGFREALVRSPGQLELVISRGFTARADARAANTGALKAYKAAGAASCTLSSGLSFEQIKGMSHVLDTEITGYGRLTLLPSRACLVKPKSGMCACENVNELTSAGGEHMPLVRDGGHGTAVLHSRKLWICGLEARWRRIGLWAVRLDFTTENPRECAQVLESFTAGGRYVPNVYTTGAYIPPETR